MINPLLELSERAQKVLGAEAVFLRVGFTHNQFQISCCPCVLHGVKLDRALVVTLTQGLRQFNYVAAEIRPDETAESVQREISAAKQLWNASEQQHRDELFLRHELVLNSVSFLTALLNKGFEMPKKKS